MPSLAPLRRALAALRLLFLYAILCSGLLATILLVRTAIEEGPAPTSPQPPADAPAPQIPLLGVTVDLTQSSAEDRRAALRRLHDAGFGWVRQRVDWSIIEPQRGDLRWHEVDAILADIVAADLVPVIVLDGSPAWARHPRDADNPLAPPQDYADFARFAAAFATRYGDRYSDRYSEDIRFYQIWDEPNIAPHWGDRLIEPVHYARLLKAAAAAIRTADADAVIVTAALAPTRDRGHTAMDEVYFLQRLYAAGAAADFDAVAVQPFGFGNPPADPRSRVDVLNFARLRLIRRVMLAAGDAQTPIWAVRFGWNRTPNANWGTVTPLAQFDYTADAIAQARSWPWLAALGWPIDRPTAPPEDPAWGFALFDAAGFPEPLLAAFALSSTPPLSSLPAWTIPAALAGFVVLAAVVFWRSIAAVRILPLQTWLTRRRSDAKPRPITEWTIIFIILILYYFATWPPLIGLCLIAAAFLIYARPLDGVLLAAALLPFHFQHKEIDLVAVSVALPPAHAALLATLPALTKAIQRDLSQRFCLLPFAVCLPNLLALTWFIISLLSAFSIWHWPAYAANLWGVVIVPLLLFMAAQRWIVYPGEWRALAWALGIGGCVAASVGLIQWLGGGGVSVDGVRRLMGLTFSPNQTALYLLRTLFLLVGVALDSQRRWAWTAVALTATTLFLTGSRGALLLGIPAGTMTLLWLGGGLRRPRPWVMAAIGLVVVAVVGIGVWVLGERLQNSETVLRRFAIWEGAAALWSSTMWIGVGPGGFFWRYPAFIVPAAVDEPNLLHAHNIWLNVATGWGILGLAWMAALLAWLVRVAKRLRSQPVNWIAVGALAALAAALAHAQVDAFLVLPELAAWNWLIFALLAQTTPNTMDRSKQNANRAPV